MTREEAITVLRGLSENPLFSNQHKAAFSIAIHDIKAHHDWDINDLILINKDNYEPLEQEPTTKNNLEVDCISRADARKAIIDHQYSNSFCEEHNIDNSINVGMALIVLSDLPSVTPQEPKMGHWIDKQRLFESCSAECSSCHKRSNGYLHDNGFSLVSKYFDFCPKCGSDNREVEDGECK